MEVIGDYGVSVSPRYRYGSGCVVVGRTVLTAAHVVRGAVTVLVRRSDKVLHPATADPAFVGDENGPGPDLALVELGAEAGVDLPAMPLAAVDRNSTDAEVVERCHAIGYPWFAERPSLTAVRDTADAYGHIPVLSKLVSGLLSMHVISSPRALPPAEVALGRSEWSGMSGAPVIAHGCLIGVVTEHASREGPSTITVTPLMALEPNPTHPGWGPGVSDPGVWWTKLGASTGGAAKLWRLPEKHQRPEPAYRATIREIQSRTPQLTGRQNELREIARFATGPSGYRWLQGKLWAGKTALLAEAVVVALSANVDVVAYFLSRCEGDADLSHFLAAVMPQLAYLIDANPHAIDLHQFRGMWERAAQRAMSEDRHLLLVVDGLDEDLLPPGSPSVAMALPSSNIDRAHVLVSSRLHYKLPSDVRGDHALRSVTWVSVEPFEGAAELRMLAAQEIDQLTRRDADGFAASVLGALAAAAGPLSTADVAALTCDTGAPTTPHTARVRKLLLTDVTRSLQPLGPSGSRRYQFAHESLLAQAQADEQLSDPAYRERIHTWATEWRATGWPVRGEALIHIGSSSVTPRYLLDAYPSTLSRDPLRLTALARDVGWICAAIQTVGVDKILAVLNTARSTDPADLVIRTVCAAVGGQARFLRDADEIHTPGFVERQLCLYSAELGDENLADAFRSRLLAGDARRLDPTWTIRRPNPAYVGEIRIHKGKVRAMAVLPDGRVVTGGTDGRILVWDSARPGAEPIELGTHDFWVLDVAVLPDGRVASGGTDRRVLLWDPTHPGADPLELGTHYGWVSAVAALPDGRVVTGGADRRVRVWDPAQPGADPVELGCHDDWVKAIAAFPDGRVATASNDQLRVWDPSHPDTHPIELGTPTSRVWAVAVLADGRVVTAGHAQLCVWDPTHPYMDPLEFHVGSGWVWAVAALPDGRVVTGDDDGRVMARDPARPDTGPLELGTHDLPVQAVAVLPDGRVFTAGEVFTYEEDAQLRVELRVWDPTYLGIHRRELDTQQKEVCAVVVLPDGRVFAAGEYDQLRVWDPLQPCGRPLELGVLHERVFAAAVLPDGRVVIDVSQYDLQVSNPAHPDTPPTFLRTGFGLKWGRVLAIAALPDGRVVGGGTDGWVRIWDDPTSNYPRYLGTHDGPVRTVAGLPDGRVASGGGDRRVRVWDPARLDAGVLELGTHDGEVLAMAVLPDGRIVTGGDDRRVRVWDPARPGTGPLELGTHDGPARAVAVLPDGRVVTGGDDLRVRVWEPEGPRLAELIACSVTALATGTSAAGQQLIVIAHERGGITVLTAPMSHTT